MKPCAHNRKLLMDLALDILDAAQGRALRVHLETCEGCRAYLVEIRQVTESLAGADFSAEIEPGPHFHRNTIAKLREEASNSLWEDILAPLRKVPGNWRVAVPLAAAAVIAIAFFSRPPRVGVPVETVTQATPPSPVDKRDLAPSLSNYQLVANHSFDNLDDLLTRQANHHLAPAPIYTAAARHGALLAD